MFERDRTDTDIEFDFFDDAPTTEQARSPEAPPKRRRRIPTRPPSGGTPLLRLAALIIGGILLAVVLVLWISSCRDDQKTGEYRDYMTNVGRIAANSQQIGQDLNTLIFSAGIQVPDLQTELEGLRQAQTQTVRQAEELNPPGPLREQHEEFVEAMQLRVSGLNGLARGFSAVTDTDTAETAGALLAQQSNRLVASDVVYADSFMTPSVERMEEQGVRGIEVPPSGFVSNPELASPASWKLIVERLTQPAATGGLRGNKIAGVRVQPGGQQLSPSEENTVPASDRLVVEVLVNNSGEAQETQVKVNLTIQQSPEPIRKEATIDAINPGDTKVVPFRDFGGVSFGSRTILKVSVEPVAGEENTNNNAAEYVVFFTLGG